MADPLDDKMSAFQALPREQKLKRMQVLDDDTRSSFISTYNEWKASRPKPQQQYDMNTVAPQGGSVMSAGVPSPSVNYQNKNLNETGAASKMRAFVGTAAPFVAPIIDQASHLVREMTGQGNEYAPQAYAMGQVPGSAQKSVNDSVKQYPSAAFLGSFTNPSLGGGNGIATRVATGATQGAIQGGNAAMQAGQDPTTGALIGAGLGGSLPVAASGATWLSNKIQELVGPAAAKYIGSIAQKMLNSKGRISGQVQEQIRKPGTSLMGFQTRLDDMKYIVANELNPQMGESLSSQKNKMAQLVGKSDEAIGTARAYGFRNKSVPAEQVISGLQNQASNLQQGRRFNPASGVTGNVDPRITAGKSASQIIRNEYIPEFEGLAQSGRPIVGSFQNGPVLPQQRLGFNVPQATPDWTPPEMIGNIGNQIPDVTAKQGQKLNQMLDPKDYQYIVTPGMQNAQAPAKRVASDVIPYEQQQSNPVSFNAIPQTSTRQGFMVQGKSNTLVPLEKLDRMRAQMRGSQYKPSTVLSNPQAALEQSSQAVDDMLMSYADPQSVAAINQAKRRHQLIKQTSSTFLENTAGMPAAGITQNTPKAHIIGNISQAIGQRARPILLQSSKAVAQRALDNIEKAGLGKIDPNTAMFNSEQIRNKLRILSQMDDASASVFAYAESMKNPAFRMVWMRAKEGKDE